MELEQAQLIAHCVDRNGLDAAALLQSLSDRRHADIERLLVQVLLQEAEVGRVAVQAHELDAPTGWGAVLHRRRDGKSQVVYSFAIRDAATETALPILGLLLTVLAATPWVPWVQGAAVVKTLWGKLVRLRRPEDGEAIDVLDALARAAARQRWAEGAPAPTAVEIAQEAGIEIARAIAALTRLERESVVEVAEWAGQRGETAAEGNRWRVRF